MNKKSKKKLMNDVESTIYWASIITIVFTMVMYVVQIYVLDYLDMMDIMQCQMKLILGIPCPGCGGTRSIMSLIKGDILSSIYYNAFATYICVVYGVFFITQTLQRITKGKIHGVKYRNIYLWIAIAILIIQYILKLIIPGYTV